MTNLFRLACAPPGLIEGVAPVREYLRKYVREYLRNNGAAWLVALAAAASALLLTSLPAAAQGTEPAKTAAAAATPAAAPTTATTTTAVPAAGPRRLALAAPSISMALPVETEQLMVSVGDIRMLPVRGKIKRIALGNGAFASATTVDANIMLIGEQPGQTSMMVWTENSITAYRLRVMPAGSADSRQFLDQLVADSGKSLTMQDFDSRLVVSGVASKSTLDQLNSLAKFIPGLVVNVREDREQVRSVLFRLHFVEVNKSLLESLGVQWAKEAPGPSFGAQGIVGRTGIFRNIAPPQGPVNLLDPERPFVQIGGRTTGVFFGLATSIASRLKLGSNDGDTRVLASPELTAISGGKARLQVGGEVPIPLAGAFGTQTVEFKPYGIIFNIEPVIGANDVIMAKISTELSQIDPAVSVAGIPGFLTRMTSTEISVRPGEMVALSGLVNSELSNAIDKVPGLGNVPVLGRLFRSDDFRNKRTDLVVLLEPEIVSSGEGMAERLKQRGVDSTKEFEDKVRAAVKPAAAAPAPAPAVYTAPDPMGNPSKQ